VGVSELALQLLNGVATDLEKDLPSKKRQKLSWAIERLSFKSVKEIAGKYASMVDDISKQLGKKVKFSVNGDTLISNERSQLLRECLVHLLRNSIDHGFEQGAARLSAGKSDVGNLSIECSEEADTAVIAITDDGAGIDGDQVLKRAIQKGLVTEAEAMKMSAEDKVNLIFAPNFSTKTEVSEISGRGIGLDVVKKNIEAMNGELKILTEKGKGSKFLIRLKPEAEGDIRATG
jgi:two-component system chemotaxis sensor kinase CheA